MRMSEHPLISQMLVDNVTSGINESNIYCFEDGDEIGNNQLYMIIYHCECMYIIIYNL